jgi:hypothetical protein
MFPIRGTSEKIKAVTMGPYRTEAGKEWIKKQQKPLFPKKKPEPKKLPELKGLSGGL